jgi:hypothetical protein
VAAWPVHKLICDTLPFPKRESNDAAVYGFYLVSDSDVKPIVVSVPVKKVNVEKDGATVLVDEVDVAGFLGNVPIGKNVVSVNPVSGKRLLGGHLEVRFRDNYYMDGSRKNLIVDKLAGNQNPVDWNGPVVVLKCRGEEKIGDVSYPSYVDVELKDLNDAADFFKCFGTEE